MLCALRRLSSSGYVHNHYFRIKNDKSTVSIGLLLISEDWIVQNES